MLRPQENRCGGDLLQAWSRPDQSQWRPHRARETGDSTVQGLRAGPLARPLPLRRRRHANPGTRRWQDFSDIRYTPEHRQGPCRFLPEVR